MTENMKVTSTTDLSMYEGQEGLERLFYEYNPRLVKVVGPLVPSSAVLDDILQEVWIRVYKALPRFKGNSSLFTWLYRIAVNTAFTALKKIEYPSDESVFQNLRSSSEPEKEYERSVLKKDMAKALNRLNVRQKEIFLLRMYEGLAFKEIGASIGVTENNARVSYFHALKKMRFFLKNHAPTRK